MKISYSYNPIRHIQLPHYTCTVLNYLIIHVQYSITSLYMYSTQLPLYTFTFTFSRRFYPKRLTLHSSYSFYILSALAFPGNQTHDLGVANAMLYQLSYRKATCIVLNYLFMHVRYSAQLENNYCDSAKGPTIQRL